MSGNGDAVDGDRVTSYEERYSQGVDMTNSTAPKWLTATAVLALVWNAMGCMAYLADVRMTPEEIAALPAVQQQLVAARPAWAVAATAVAVWAGLLGSLGLLLRRRWAFPVFVASLIGVLVQDYALFLVSRLTGGIGIVPLVLQALVLLIAVLLVMLARRGVAQGWLK